MTKERDKGTTLRKRWKKEHIDFICVNCTLRNVCVCVCGQKERMGNTKGKGEERWRDGETDKKDKKDKERKRRKGEERRKKELKIDWNEREVKEMVKVERCSEKKSDREKENEEQGGYD